MPWTRVQRSMNQVLPISEVNFPWRTREKPAVGKTVQPVRSIPTPFWQRAGTNGSWIKDIKIKCGPSASCLNDEVFSRCYFFVWRGFHSLVMCWLHSWETWKARRVARSYATNTSSNFFWKKYGIHILQLDHSMIHSGPGWKEPQVETQQYFCLYLSCYTRNTFKKSGTEEVVHQTD